MDFSTCSAAYRLACALARYHRARLVIAHVLATPVAADVGGSLVPDPVSLRKESGREELSFGHAACS
jgi:hypothetical protein